MLSILKRRFGREFMSGGAGKEQQARVPLASSLSPGQGSDPTPAGRQLENPVPSLWCPLRPGWSWWGLFGNWEAE